MNKDKRLSLNLVIIHLGIEILFTLIWTINERFLILSLVLSFFILIKEKTSSRIYLNHYHSSFTNAFFHYFISTFSYAEILPWETAIVVLLFLLIFDHNIKLNSLIDTRDINWSKKRSEISQEKRNGLSFSCLFDQMDEEINSNMKWAMYPMKKIETKPRLTAISSSHRGMLWENRGVIF